MPNQFRINGKNLVSVVACNEGLPKKITVFKEKNDIYVNVPTGCKPTEYFLNNADGRFHTDYVLVENKSGEKALYSGYGDILSQRKIVNVNMAEGRFMGWNGNSVYCSEIKFENSLGEEYAIKTSEFGEHSDKMSELVFERKGAKHHIELERLLH